MHLIGPSSFDVDAHTQHEFPVTFHSTGLQPGEYQGTVLIRCMTCKHESGCIQDRQVLRVFMRVEPGEPANPQEFVPGRVLAVVPWDSSANVEAIARTLARAHGLRVVEINPLDSIHAALVVYALSSGSDVLARVTQLAPEVLIAQPDYLFRTSSAEQESNSRAQLQYGPKLIRADLLQGLLTGKGVRVAIIDTGVDSHHPALEGKVAEQYDATATGFTPDVHATLLAGIIVSEPRDSSGILGIAPGAEILAIKACQPFASQTIQAQCWSLTLAKGLDFAMRKKARVINLSLSGPNEKLLTRLIAEAISRGITVVAAAGNDGPHGQPSFPAALPQVIAVTAVDANKQIYPEATQGDFISLAAPGVEIVSTSPGGKVMVSSGTSFAAAFVTGTAGLVLEQQPQLSPSSLRSLLESTATDLGSPGKDSQFGSGLLNACQAVAQLRRDPRLCH